MKAFAVYQKNENVIPQLATGEMIVGTEKYCKDFAFYMGEGQRVQPVEIIVEDESVCTHFHTLAKKVLADWDGQDTIELLGALCDELGVHYFQYGESK